MSGAVTNVRSLLETDGVCSKTVDCGLLCFLKKLWLYVAFAFASNFWPPYMLCMCTLWRAAWAKHLAVCKLQMPTRTDQLLVDTGCVVTEVWCFLSCGTNSVVCYAVILKALCVSFLKMVEDRLKLWCILPIVASILPPFAVLWGLIDRNLIFQSTCQLNKTQNEACWVS